jgi:hypothetical protein
LVLSFSGKASRGRTAANAARLVVAQALVAEAEHVVLLEGLAHARQRRRVEWAGDIEADHFGAECGGEAIDGDVDRDLRHRPCPPIGRYPAILADLAALAHGMPTH